MAWPMPFYYQCFPFLGMVLELIDAVHLAWSSDCLRRDELLKLWNWWFIVNCWQSNQSCMYSSLVDDRLDWLYDNIKLLLWQLFRFLHSIICWTRMNSRRDREWEYEKKSCSMIEHSINLLSNIKSMVIIIILSSDFFFVLFLF